MPSPPSLTVMELFTPAPSGVGQTGAVPLSPPSGSWLSIELQIAATVQLPTTSWQPGAPERTILAINAVCMSQDDALISQMAQGAFLDTAATGTVTYQTLSGQQVTIYVTPDPSNVSVNPTGELGYLDLTTQGVYGVSRLPATYATGQLAIANTTSASVGPYIIGNYHVSSQTAAYHNTASLTIPSGIIPGGGGSVASVTPGLTSTIISTSAANGIAPGQTVYVNIPASSGISGLSGIFALVGTVSGFTFSISATSSGSYVGGGQVYSCTTATMAADLIGTIGNATPGAVTQTVTQNAGVFCSNVVPWSGSNWESNGALVIRTRNSLAAASPNGPSQAYQYFAASASALLAAQTPPYTLTNGSVIANAFANPQTGIETVVVASASPLSTVLGSAVTPGCAQALVSAATNSTPIVLTLSSPCGLSTGMSATVSGVLGNFAANGSFTVITSGPSSTSITLNGSAGSGVYTGGGTVEGGDLGAIDALIQQNVVPDAIVGAVTVSALALPIVINTTVVVPKAYVQTYLIAAAAQLLAQTQSYPLGGVFSNETVPIAWNDYLGALEEAGVLTLGSVSYVRQVQTLSVTVNGITMTNSTQSVPFPTNQYQAILVTPVISVVGV